MTQCGGMSIKMEEKDTKSRLQETGNQESGKRKRPKRLLPLILALVLAAGGGIYWWTSRPAMDETTKYWFDKAAQSGSLEGKSPEDIQSILNTIVEEGMFNVSVNARAVFENGQSAGSLGLENVSANRYYCRVSLVRDDNGETVYKSAGIKPGQYIDEITLSKNLPAGTYPCTAQVIATDPETLDDIGQVDVQVEVVVLN